MSMEILKIHEFFVMFGGKLVIFQMKKWSPSVPKESSLQK